MSSWRFPAERNLVGRAFTGGGGVEALPFWFRIDRRRLCESPRFRLWVVDERGACWVADVEPERLLDRMSRVCCAALSGLPWGELAELEQELGSQ